MLSKDKDTDKNMPDSIKDTKNILASYKPEGFRLESVMLSYNKTHKLITALYMVTDIIDKEEPIRNKLRTLGTEILSDIISFNSQNLQRMILCKIEEVMSFLNIASAMNFISEMNCAILQKEFLELQKSIKESTQAKPIWLEKFLSESPLLNKEGVGGGNSDPLSNLPLGRGRGSFTTSPFGHSSSTKRRELNSKGHTRIGVQKGSTLMQALSDRITYVGRPISTGSKAQDFDILKIQRRDNIIRLIKIIGSDATIKDIKDKIKEIPEQVSLLVSCSEKTLQRELMSMIKDGVLNKEGSKRWSKYFIKN